MCILGTEYFLLKLLSVLIITYFGIYGNVKKLQGGEL